MTKQQNAALQLVAAVGEAIQSLGSIPNGHLYARMMNTLDIQSYNRIIGMLQNTKLVELKNDTLTWIGPTISR